MEHKDLRTKWKDEYNPSLHSTYQLFGWQRIGVTFLHECAQRFGFAMLADEMGVGKVNLTVMF
jgi:hypothetical protein